MSEEALTADTLALNADTLARVLVELPTTEALNAASASSDLRAKVDVLLQDGAVKLASTPIEGPQLLWLLKERLGAKCVQLDVSECEHLTKAQIAQALAAAPHLEVLRAVRVGLGSWSARHIDKLIPALPSTLKSCTLDCRVELRNDLGVESALLGFFQRDNVCVERLTLIADNVTSNRPAETGAGGDTIDSASEAAAAAAMAAATIHDDQAIDLEPADEDAEAAEGPPIPDDEASQGLRRLCKALEDRQMRHLIELDAASGALADEGGVPLLLAPVLVAPEGRLQTLSASRLPPAPSTMRRLGPALRANRSLTHLNLSLNMMSGSACGRLASAIEHHPTLSHLLLEHNPILDRGGAALAAILPTTRLASLSLAFTGVADGTCEALALAMGTAEGGCVLRSLNLTGNRITSAGVAAFTAGGLHQLRMLDLGANVLLTGDATVALAAALPSSELRSLRLSGCGVDKKACGKLAAGLLRSKLEALDLSANHFGSDGSDEIAWVLAQCEALTTLSLADCNLNDEAADELLDALAEAKLTALDLRWNRLDAAHRNGRGISADARVDASAQKQKSAAERQTEALEASFAAAKAAKGKAGSGKVYRPKWTRGQTSSERGAASGKKGSSGSTAQAIG